jgi:hypothetical protein
VLDLCSLQAMSAMLGYLSSSTEWLQQHIVHLLLRRNLSHFFEDPVDISQLKVQLGRHALHQGVEWKARLSDVRISKAALNSHLVRVLCKIVKQSLRLRLHTPDLSCS